MPIIEQKKCFTPESAALAIESYHNSMFSGEYPHSRWVAECVEYLRTMFPDGFDGKTVIDYGFGRGNWSLAFKRLGASKVISVDASGDAVSRFKKFIENQGIDGIEVIKGNTDLNKLYLQADMVFLYGILHHVASPQALLRNCHDWLKDREGEMVVYAYDANSLRQIVVEISRLALAKAEVSHLDNYMRTCLHPDARQRAADDLVAPVVTFWSAAQLTDIVQRSGFFCLGQYRDFAAFQGKSLSPEFDPYVLSVKVGKLPSIKVRENSQPFSRDLAFISMLGRALVGDLPLEVCEAFSIGLFNTSFSRNYSDDFEERLLYIWRFLVHQWSCFGRTSLDSETARLVQKTLHPDSFGSLEDLVDKSALVQKLGMDTFRL